MPVRIDSIVTSASDTLTLGDFNILVGPNNSGKSQTLNDIRDYLRTGSAANSIILRELSITLPSPAESTSELSMAPDQRNPEQINVRGVDYDLLNQKQTTTQEGALERWMQSQPNEGNLKQLLRGYGAFWIAHLNAERRFKLSSHSESYDVRKDHPSNAMQAFYQDHKKNIKALRDAFKTSFGTDIALDWAALRNFYFRVGADFGTLPDTREELDLLLRDCESLETQGDGYRSFAGVVMAMLTFPQRLLLLDEPEAFLHPAQARSLGRWVARESKTRQSQVILATHNSDFLWGVVSERSDATVIRLNRDEDATKYSIVPSEATSGLAASPLLSSQPVLDSLFQKGVVVCEGDPDRAIYQTVAHRELQEYGGEEILFIHANGKDSVKNPIQLLRLASTPVATITDIDVLNSEAVFSNTISALTGTDCPGDLLEKRNEIAQLVEQETDASLIASLRSGVEEWNTREFQDWREARKALSAVKSNNSNWSKVKNEGIKYFTDEDDKKLVKEVILRCAEIGLFIVPVGELESWVPVKAKKGYRWNKAALKFLFENGGPDPLTNFIRHILDYLLGHSVHKK